MSNPVEQEHVYCHILKGSPFIFADERCKKKLLDLTLDLFRRHQWRLYAFCVTDSKAYFLSAAEGNSSCGEFLQRAIDDFLCWNICEPGIWSGDSPDLCLEELQKRCTAEELVNCCCALHHIPKELNYVQQIQDYWWSSYHTYIGSFEWKAVDCQKILLYFSDSPRLARIQLRKFHSSFESPTLYITKAFSKHDAENKNKMKKQKESISNLFLKKLETL